MTTIICCRVGDEHEFEAPSDAQLECFKATVIANGIFCTIRKSTTSGREVDGACGQLALKGNGMDIEDLVQKQKASSRGKRKRNRRRIRKTETINKMDKGNAESLTVSRDEIMDKMRQHSVLLGIGICLAIGSSYWITRYVQNQRTSKHTKTTSL